MLCMGPIECYKVVSTMNKEEGEVGVLQCKKSIETFAAITKRFSHPPHSDIASLLPSMISFSFLFFLLKNLIKTCFSFVASCDWHYHDQEQGVRNTSPKSTCTHKNTQPHKLQHHTHPSLPTDIIINKFLPPPSSSFLFSWTFIGSMSFGELKCHIYVFHILLFVRFKNIL